METTTLKETKEAEILREIRDSEKKAEDIVEKAKRKKEEILQEAARNSSKLLDTKKEEIRKLQEKKLMDFRDKASLVRDEKVKEGRKAADQAKAEAEKNTDKAVEFVIKTFEAMI